MPVDLKALLLDRLRAQRVSADAQRKRMRSKKRKSDSAVLGMAKTHYADRWAAEAHVWAALDGHGGKVVPDMIQRHGKWMRAGEFADIPERFLGKPAHLNPNRIRVCGNLDKIAQAARMSEDDLRAFLADNPRRPSMAEAKRYASRTLIEMKGKN